MTQIWGDIYDALGRRVGAGPVWSLTNATITRALDGAGSVTVSAPGTEARALDLLTNERRIKVYGLQPGAIEGQPTTRRLGSGIIRDVDMKGTASSWTLSADGPDSLDELKRKSVLLGRIYNGQTLGQIVSDLAGLAGWTALLDSNLTAKAVQYRFDGVSALKALQQIASQNGLHLREGTTERVIEIGAFGTSSGLRLVNAAYAPPDLAANDSICLVETLSIKRVSEQVVNWLIPIGGGEGESAITLEHSTRTGPYDIRTIVVGIKTYYYIAADDSIALYGQIEKVGTFKDINAISNSDADLEAAANALYDAAVAWLIRNKDRIDTYRVSVRKIRTTVRPGDKVRLTYKDFITNEQGIIVNYANVDADFWVMKATERVGLEGISLDLEITNVDQMALDAAQIVIGAIDAIQMQQLRVQPYPSAGTFVYGYAIDATHTVRVPIEISNGVLYLNQARLFIKSTPFRALSKAVATGDITTSAGGASAQTSSAGGAHRHLVFTNTNLGDYSPSLMRTYLSARSDGTQNLAVVLGASPDPADIYTYDAAANHTHSINIPAHTHTVPALQIDFGIEDDSQYPDTMSIKVDDVDVTAALGGPWGVGAAAIDLSLDITSYLVNASGGLRQRHVVEFSCTGGQGWIETTVELRTTVQSIVAQ